MKSFLKLSTSNVAVHIILFTLLTIGTGMRGFACIQFTTTERTEQQTALGEIRELKLGDPIEREMGRGAVHSYALSLTKGQFVKVVVEQKGIDVVVSIFAPGGEKIEEVDSLDGAKGPEEVLFIAETGGNFRLDVKAFDANTLVGHYEIKLESLREGEAQDRTEIAARGMLKQAQKLRVQGTKESLCNAIEKFKEARSLWSSIGNQGREGDMSSFIALCHARLSESQKAIEFHLEALRLRRLTGDRLKETQTLINVGAAYAALSENRKGIEYLSEALNLARQLGSEYLQMQTLTHLGGIYLASDLQKTFEYYTEALSKVSALKEPSWEAFILDGLGQLYWRRGEPQKALASSQRALALHSSIGDRKAEANTLSNIARILRATGETDRALEYLERSLALQRATGYRLGEGAALTFLGESYLSLNQQRVALTYFEQAVEIAHQLGNRDLEATALTGIANCHRDLGEFQVALDYSNRALRLEQEIPSREGEAWTLGQIGGTYDSMGDAPKAVAYLQQALEMQRAIGARRDEATTLRFLALALRNQNRLDEALRQIELAINIVEESRSDLIGPQLRTSFSASTQKFYELYINLLMQMHQKEPLAGHDVTAFAASERARARSLLDLLTESRADIRQGVDLALLERERSLQQQLNSRSEQLTRLLSGKHTEEQEMAARKEVEALLTNFQDVEAQIRVHSPRYSALTQPQPLSLKEIQQLLDENTVLLEYALGGERSYLWAVTTKSIKSFELPPRAEIETAARRVYELLVAQADDLYPEALTKLSRMLLNPAADLLGKKRLLIVSEGTLQYIPFGALPVSESPVELSGRRVSSSRQLRATSAPLIQNHEIVSLPSASVVGVLRREMGERRSAPKTLAVLADPVFDKDDQRVTKTSKLQKTDEQRQIEKDVQKTDRPSALQRATRDFGVNNFDRLVLSRREADQITALASGGQPLKALDFAASRATATDSDLSQYRIIHFATHSLLNSKQPELSGIVLSLVDEHGRPQDGFLRLYEIFNLKLDADLVVLSACQTALGKEIKGEGLVGLTRGFMYAGAPRVVASLWKVSDEATAELMKRFYQKMLRDGLRPAAALRAAQVSMLNEKQRSAAYYWAGFVLQGEWK